MIERKTKKPHSSISRLEQLPDEILLDLFENYIRLIDLYSAFAFLNHRRINRILNSARFYIDIPSKDVYHPKSFAHFQDQIISIHLSSYCNDLDLLKFVHLRFLHIEKPSRPQLLAIRSEFLPNLLYLSLSPCWYSFKELPRYLTNISNACPFKNLRFCILPDGKVIRLQQNSS
jgi:hypothetical protein